MNGKLISFKWKGRKSQALSRLVIMLSFIIFPADVNSGNVRNAEVRTTPYFQVLHDIPVMHGLEVMPGKTVNFDKPSGRIVEEAAYLKNNSWGSVLSYYDRVLPQLGWEKVLEGNYTRDDERLVFVKDFSEGSRLVVLKVMPKNEKDWN